MVYENPFIKFTFGGALTGTDEIWACGFNISQEITGITPTQWASFGSTALEAVAATIGGAIGNEFSYVPQDYVMQWAKAAYIGVDGKYISEPVEAVQLDYFGSNTQAFAPQLASVITLEANKWRDPGKYNRFYLPTVGIGGSSGGRTTVDRQEQTGNLWSTAIETVNFDLSDIPGSVRVMVVSDAGSGHANIVERVRIGRVLDTQRRRRNALNEDYDTFIVEV